MEILIFTKFFIFFSFFILTVCSSQDEDCLPPVILHQTSNFNDMSNTHEIRADILMKVDNTICFKSQREIIKLRLLSQKIEFPISESYSFNLPDLKTSCHCQCKRKSSLECSLPDCNSKDCFSKTLIGQTCSDNNIPERVCCQTHVLPSLKNFKAFHLGHPQHVFTILAEWNHQNSTSSSSRFKVTGFNSAKHFYGESGASFHVRMATVRPDELSQVNKKGDWIVSSYNDDPDHFYHVNEGFINENFERDISKLGWYRPQHNENLDGIQSSLTRRLDVGSFDCKDEIFNITFQGFTSQSNINALFKLLDPTISEVSEKHKVVRFDYGENQGPVQANLLLKSNIKFSIFSHEISVIPLSVNLTLQKNGIASLAINSSSECAILSGTISLLPEQETSEHFSLHPSNCGSFGHKLRHVRLSNRYENNSRVKVCFDLKDPLGNDACFFQVVLADPESRVDQTLPEVHTMDVTISRNFVESNQLEDIIIKLKRFIGLERWLEENLVWPHNLILILKLCASLIILAILCKFVACFRCKKTNLS